MTDSERNSILEDWIAAHTAIWFEVARDCGSTHSVEAFRGNSATST
jgi:hypothetical protein